MYLTFDVGTTSVKAILYSTEGKLVYKGIKDYKLNSLHVDWYEVEPETYWRAVLASMDQSTSAVGVGNTKPGIITETTGSAMVVAVITDERSFNQEVALSYQAHVISDKYLILTYAQQLELSTNGSGKSLPERRYRARVLWKRPMRN